MKTVDYDMSIHSNPDHYAWARFFIESWPNGCSDEETMAGWFANAMMAKHDSMASSEMEHATEWVDGLPPLRTLVEVFLKNGNRWFPAKANAYSNDYVVLESSGKEWAALKSDYEFRPIQLKQTERENFALEMVKASKDYSFGENLTAEDARQIYDWLSSDRADRLNKDGE